MNERSIFMAALERDTPDQRSSYLDEVCAGDTALRQRVEALLRSHEQAGSFLKAPARALVATVDEPVSERPGTVIGPYKLMEQIGEGGMGLVFVAEQQQPVRRRVALKVIKPGMDTREVIARFEAERQALALMDHPNIARVLDGGTTKSGQPYFVMELVKGVPITQFCDDNQLTPRERLELFVSVCQAVQHAHQKGIIHRDVKPSNVLVASHDGTPVVKVIDFGVAKAVGQLLTEKTVYTGIAQMLGTPLYMSPEQAGMSGLDIDTRTDIYALGVLLYELLTGTTPFDKERLKEASYDEIRRIIIEQEPVKPSARISTLGQAAATVSANRQSDPRKLSQLMRGELDWIVMKALEKDRNRRYETANDFAADVQRYLHDEPVLACPPSAWYRFRKFARRNKAGLGVVGLTLAFLLLLGGAVGWVLRDQAAQQAIVEEKVIQALEEVERTPLRDKLPQALAALKRAEVLLERGGGSEELRQRVSRWRTDLDLMVRLQDAMMQEMQVNVGERRFSHELAVSGYEAAFVAYGLDPASLTAEEAVRQMGSRSPEIQLALITALEHWIDLELELARTRGKKPQNLAWLQAVVQTGDRDPWRVGLREAIQQRNDEALAKMADSPELSVHSPYTLERLGNVLCKKSGKPELGLAVLRRAQQIYPGDFRINSLLGLELLQAKPPQHGDAVRFCAIAAALQPDNVGALIHLSVALYKQGRLDEAITVCDKAVKLKPNHAGAHTNLGYLWQAKGRLDLALAAQEKAIALDNGYALAHYNLGKALQAAGRLDEAIAAFQRAIDLDGEFAAAHSNLGDALWVRGRLDEAIAAHEKAVAFDSENATYHTSLGAVLRIKGRADEAITAHEKAIALDPQLAAAHSNHGIALRDKGRLDEAIAAFEKAITLDPKFAGAHVNLGSAWRARGRPDLAQAGYEKAIAIDPQYAPAHNNLGNLWRDKGQLDLAIACFEKAIAVDPRHVLAHFNLGKAWTEKGRLDLAQAAYEKVIAIDPRHAQAQFNLGHALRHQGKFEEAIAAYRKAAQLTPNHAETHCNLGLALQSNGQFREGLESLRRGHELGSKDPRWPYPSALWVKYCERMIELERRLPRVLGGEQEVANARERIAYAEVCSRKRLYEQATRFYEEALAADAGLAKDLKGSHRYNAACTAALAGIGVGEDAHLLVDEQRARRRGQARDWLRADLQLHAQALNDATPTARAATARTLQHWLNDRDLKGLRDDDDLAKLPPQEREACVKLWQEVHDLLARAQGK